MPTTPHAGEVVLKIVANCLAATVKPEGYYRSRSRVTSDPSDPPSTCYSYDTRSTNWNDKEIPL